MERSITCPYKKAQKKTFCHERPVSNTLADGGEHLHSMINTSNFLKIHEMHDAAEGVHAVVLIEVPTEVRFTISKITLVYTAI